MEGMVDVDLESQVKMKVTGPTSRPFTTLDFIKQAIHLFIHAKLAINTDHCFAFATLGKSAYWSGYEPKRRLLGIGLLSSVQ
ncbi:hypothetical protein RJ639_024826, partial [Escallonia herrerae]